MFLFQQMSNCTYIVLNGEAQTSIESKSKTHFWILFECTAGSAMLLSVLSVALGTRRWQYSSDNEHQQLSGCISQGRESSQVLPPAASACVGSSWLCKLPYTCILPCLSFISIRISWIACINTSVYVVICREACLFMHCFTLCNMNCPMIVYTSSVTLNQYLSSALPHSPCHLFTRPEWQFKPQRLEQHLFPVPEKLLPSLQEIKGRLSQSLSRVLGADHFLTQSILIYMGL